MRLVPRPWTGPDRRPPVLAALPLVVAVMGLLALLAPFGPAEKPLTRVGALLALSGALEILHGLRRAEPAAVRRAIASGFITVVMGVLVVAAPYFAESALVLFLAVTFAIDGFGFARSAWRAAENRPRTLYLLAALGNAAAFVFLVATRNRSIPWLVAVTAALRMFGVAWGMAVTKVHSAADAGRTVLDEFGLSGEPEAIALQERIDEQERGRGPSDRRWTVTYVITLFAIHIARMQWDGSLLGLLAPAIAVFGDLVIAVLFALLIVVPVVVSGRSSTRFLERRVWAWYLSPLSRAGRWRRRLAEGWLTYRMRVGTRLRAARYSVPEALRRSLALGLPLAAIIAATVPVWGMSWFFDTENWASGIWNSWAESRTDRWREAMVKDVAGNEVRSAASFVVEPPGIEQGDFSFLVIGDTGEGDASQHMLRDQIWSVATRPDMRFVVLSSDVIYPNGAMIDYERKFWLPFKGVTKPVYAIPGNHDWYDALEGFLATFLQADAARTSMKARARSDLRLTSTTGARIDGLIEEAARLRREYRIPTGFQRAPFFEIQSDRFALLAIDTGVVKRIDDRQREWLEAALERARGKTIMAVVGHPFYAGGHDATEGYRDFADLKRLLLDHGATVLMAGDTHDLEFYADPPGPGAPPVLYFVNGGGGAYMSFGTSLQWPEHPPTSEWAYYPDREAIVRKLARETPWWKRPAWWWTTGVGAWPFSAEWMSGLFDYNVAPFFQSFFEVRVERSTNRLRLIPYGVFGRLSWKELGRSGSLPEKGSPDDLAEWSVPLR